MITANADILSKYNHIIQKQVDDILPDWILDNFSIEITALNEQQASYKLAYNPDLFRKVPPPRSSRFLCGQAVMALADTLLIFPVLAKVGVEREMVTLSCNTEFLRPIQPGDIRVVAEVVRAGNKVIRGQVKIFDNENKLSALSTLSYVYI